MFMPSSNTPPSMKLSQMASIRNGEIPVVVVYIREHAPRDYKLVSPDEAILLLATIERLKDITPASQPQGLETYFGNPEAAPTEEGSDDRE